LALGIFLVLLILSPFLNRALTTYIEGSAFQHLLEKQASKGLKLECQMSPLKRTGLFSVSTDTFSGLEGDRTMKSVRGREITSTFNPFGVFLKRWQIDSMEVQHAVVELQKTEYKPPPPPPSQPWYFFLFPDRFYLSKIYTPLGNVLWKFRDQRSGIYGLKMTVTPNGRDFEYDGVDGRFRMPKLPELKVVHIHTLIRKPRLYLYDAELTTLSNKGTIVINGEAGLQEDQGIIAHMDIRKMPIQPWIPEKWNESFEGLAHGTMDWESNGTKLATASAKGQVRIQNGRIHNHRTLDQMAKFTEKESLRDLQIDNLSFNFEYNHLLFKVQDLQVESRGIFLLVGDISVQKRALNGTCNLGISRTYLDWLPDVEKVFPEERGGYLWTKIHLSGTVDNPEEDLSPRIKEVILESPGTLFSFLFRQIGQWFEEVFD